MKRLKEVVLILILMVSMFSCNIRHIERAKNKKIFSGQEQELEYYYAFTEATKQAIFNNYKDAINLYNKCLKYNPESAATYFQLSNIYLRLGEIELAKQYARYAIKKDEENIWYFVHLASIYQIQRNIDSTILMYQKIVDLSHDKVDYLFNLALLYNEGKYYEKALKTLKQVEKEVGVNERIIYLKHDIYSRLGKRKEAVKELREGIDYFPDNINIIGLLAEYYSEIGDNENADSLYQEIFKRDSANSKVILSYADYLISIGKSDLAFEYYKRAINGTNISAEDKMIIVASLINDERILSTYQKEVGDLVDALKSNYKSSMKIRAISIDFNIKIANYLSASEDLKYVIKKDANNINAWRQLIYIENYLSNYDSVLYFADKASEIFNNEVSFYIMKGLAWLQKGENERAIEILLDGEKHAKNAEERIQIYGYLAELYRNIGCNSLSDKYFESALKLDEKNILIRNNYSYYLALRDTALKKAERLSKYTIETEPLNATYLDTYAWILYKMGKYKSSLKYIEKAIKNDNSNNTEMLDHYGDILVSVNKYQKAIEIWKRIQKMNGSDDKMQKKILRTEELIKDSR